MAKYLLNTAIVEEDFFSDSRLIAIGTAAQANNLCWWFNNLFGLKFKREPELDICLQEGKILPTADGSLFAEHTEEEIGKRQYHFPVYRHEFTYFEAAIYLYGNRMNGKNLIKELKNVDYLLLIQYASVIEPENDLLANILTVPNINWTRELDLDELKSKHNLII
mgnify:CR=1 FL=1